MRNGDLATLGYIAERLATYAHEPLHCNLVVLADLCRYDPDRAVAIWMRLKGQVMFAEPARPARSSSRLA